MKILFLAAGAVIACASVASDASAQRASPADSLYLQARRLLTDNDYRRAAALFKDAHDRDPKGSHAGDALFWRAWASFRADAAARERRTTCASSPSRALCRWTPSRPCRF